jgi:glycosyltransferase involved in cell wall biosynthesis
MAAPASCAGQSPGVSVVIPAYNYARYLPAAIDSALNQDYPRLEVIVVDDGSTDSTPEVVRAYGERVRYVHQNNAGLPAARNTGIRAAQHPLLCFLDADDLLPPGLVAEAVRALATLSGDFGIVAFPSQYIDTTGAPLPTKALADQESREVPGRDIILKTRFGTTGLVARREVFEQAGFFDETLRSSEDRDMWIRAASRFRIYLDGDRRVLIRRHGASMSQHADRMKENMQRVIRKAWTDRRVPRGETGFWLQVRAFLHFQAAWMYHAEGRRGAAVGSLLKSLACWPWFARPGRLNEPALFRIRSLIRFACRR